MRDEIIGRIADADMVLVGLGEEFDDLRTLRSLPGYAQKRERLEDSKESSWIPAYDGFCRKMQGSGAGKALQRLAELLSGKNYFVVSTSVNDELGKLPWREGRFVAVCGGSGRTQCIHRCKEGMRTLTQEEQARICELMRVFWEDGRIEPNAGQWGECLGRCPQCGSPLVFNNIYAECYDENGYLTEWMQYRKWIQGSMNRKLLILELGVGLQYPSVIRWPFEKLALYNQKADICRVHGSLWQLPQELCGKGAAISENPIDWLQILC